MNSRLSIIKASRFLGVLCLLPLLCANDIVIKDWEAHHQPTPLPAKVYGSYNAGCLDGGAKLPSTGQGYVLYSHTKQRQFGHPSLVEFIQHFAEIIYQKYSKTLVITDLGLPRGGPPHLKSNHRSHQTGLDVDIVYQFYDASNNNLSPRMTSSQQGILSKGWSALNDKVLKKATSFDEVDRVFVHYQIKKYLCTRYKGEVWLQKIRPWWGHDKHFHVRLTCPKNSHDCETQEPIALSDGCDESLDWWFSDEAAELAAQTSERTYPKLPYKCKKVYHH